MPNVEPWCPYNRCGAALRVRDLLACALLAWVVIACLGVATPARALDVVRYVDSRAGACAGTYSIRARSCTGSDGNSYATLAAGVAATGPGDILYVRSGTYLERIRTGVSSGLSSTQRTTFAAYEGERVTLRPSGGQHVVALSDRSHVAVVGFVLDAANARDGAAHAVTIYNGSTDVLIEGNEILNSVAQGVIVSDTAHAGILRWNYIHHNGTDHLDHGLYLSGNDWIVEGNRFEANASFGAQFYPRPLRTQARGNIFANNCTASTGGGEVNISHQGAVFENNLVYTTTGNCRVGVQIAWQRPDDNTVRHNTIYSATGRGSIGVSVQAGAARNTVENNLVIGYSMAVDDQGTGTRRGGDVTTGSASSHFVDARAGDFALLEGSGAIDRGVRLPAVATDYRGVARPQGAGWDAGAFEYTAGVLPPGSCDEQFGHLPGYELCGETATECEVALETRGTCRSACAAAGSACITGYDDAASSCARAAEVGCDTTYITQICVCSLEEAPTPDAGMPELDAGPPSPDAGPGTSPDAGPRADAGRPSATCWLVDHTLPDGGRGRATIECEHDVVGCSATPGRGGASGAVLAILIGLGLVLGRRRRARCA